MVFIQWHDMLWTMYAVYLQQQWAGGRRKDCAMSAPGLLLHSGASCQCGRHCRHLQEVQEVGLRLKDEHISHDTFTSVTYLVELLSSC